MHTAKTRVIIGLPGTMRADRQMMRLPEHQAGQNGKLDLVA
jgi:hypothetical protein